MRLLYLFFLQNITFVSGIFQATNFITTSLLHGSIPNKNRMKIHQPLQILHKTRIFLKPIGYDDIPDGDPYRQETKKDFINLSCPISDSENIQKTDKVTSKMGSPTSRPMIPGLFMGIPLTLMSVFFTYHHYQDWIITPKIAIINSMLGMYTYGMDRMYDAADYEKQNRNITTSPKKIQTYEYILSNYDILKNIYLSTYFIFVWLLLEHENPIYTLSFITLYELAKFSMALRYTFFSYYLGIHSYRLFAIYAVICSFLWQTHIFDYEFIRLPILLTLDTTKYYLDIKRNCGFIKPFYVGAMWTLAFMVLPSLIHDGNWRCLESVTDIATPFFTMAGFSNLADIKDIEEDRANGIQTIPVQYGPTIGIMTTMTCFSTAWWLFNL